MPSRFEEEHLKEMRRKHSPDYFILKYHSSWWGIWPESDYSSRAPRWNCRPIHIRKQEGWEAATQHINEAMKLLEKTPDFAGMHPKTFLKRILGK